MVVAGGKDTGEANRINVASAFEPALEYYRSRANAGVVIPTKLLPELV